METSKPEVLAVVTSAIDLPDESTVCVLAMCFCHVYLLCATVHAIQPVIDSQPLLVLFKHFKFAAGAAAVVALLCALCFLLASQDCTSDCVMLVGNFF